MFFKKSVVMSLNHSTDGSWLVVMDVDYYSLVTTSVDNVSMPVVATGMMMSLSVATIHQ
jgi:expansin (peptidoglycan-binding protein)